MDEALQTIPWPCARCGAEFDRPLTARGQAASWCRPCKREYNRAYKRKHRERYIAGACTDCGSPCYGSRCRPCYEKTRRPSTPRPVGKPRAKRPPDAELSDKQLRNDKRMKDLRLLVLSEEHVCGICGDPVDKSLHFHHRMSATVDHIVPLALGGAPFDRENVRLAHRSCNAQLGNRAKEMAQVERVAFARVGLWLGERLAV